MKSIKKDHKKQVSQMSTEKPFYKIFIDDERKPEIVFQGDEAKGWTICKSSNEAINIVSSKGYLPGYIAFDHDLGGEDTSIKFIVWMIQASLDERISGSVPDYSVHSSNPPGRKNIESKMESWKRIMEL